MGGCFFLVPEVCFSGSWRKTKERRPLALSWRCRDHQSAIVRQNAIRDAKRESEQSGTTNNNSIVVLKTGVCWNAEFATLDIKPRVTNVVACPCTSSLSLSLAFSGITVMLIYDRVSLFRF